MEQADRDTEGMQGDGVRDDAAHAADDRAKAGEPASRTSEDAMRGAGDGDGGEAAADERGEPAAD